AALAQRRGIVLSIGAATLVWFLAAMLLQSLQWTPASALALNAIVFACTIPLSARYRAAVASQSIKRRGYDLPLRAAAVAVVVAVVTTASHWIGSFASGVFAIFPIVMGSLVVVIHPRVGGKAAAAVFAHAQPALVGLCLGFLGVHYRACHHHRLEHRALAVTPAASGLAQDAYFSIESFCARISSAHLRLCAPI